MFKYVKPIVMIFALSTAIFAGNKTGRVQQLCISQVYKNGTCRTWFKLDGDATKYTIIEENVGRSRSDKMVALLLASKTKALNVMFDEDTPGDIQWLILD